MLDCAYQVLTTYDPRPTTHYYLLPTTYYPLLPTTYNLLLTTFQGFASGDAEKDAFAIRKMLADGHSLLLAQVTKVGNLLVGY